MTATAALGDLFPYYMENLDADNIRLEAMTREQLDNRMYDRPYEVEAAEPEVPLQHMVWREFEASSPFDVICLARSPDYTPVELDPLFDEICQRFIDERRFDEESPASMEASLNRPRPQTNVSCKTPRL